MNTIDALWNSFRNKAAVLASEKCGCYCCLSVFASPEVQEFIDNGETAICPNCDTDAVLPNIYKELELVRAHKRWFIGGK